MATDLISTSIHVFFNISVVGAEPSCPSASNRTAAELPSSIETDGWSISGLVSILHGEVSITKLPPWRGPSSWNGDARTRTAKRTRRSPPHSRASNSRVSLNIPFEKIPTKPPQYLARPPVPTQPRTSATHSLTHQHAPASSSTGSLTHRETRPRTGGEREGKASGSVEVAKHARIGTFPGCRLL